MKKFLAVPAVLAIGAVGLSACGSSSSITSYTAAASYQGYQSKLAAIMTPVVNSNVALSKAVQAIDGSGSTLKAAGDNNTATQQAVVAARGALTALVVPSSQQALNQEAAQALTQESGYLQSVSSTLVDPNSSAAGSLQPLASATNAAFIPLANVVPGGSASIYGVNNFLGWVSGAKTQAQKAHDQQQAQQLKPSITNVYNGGGYSGGYVGPSTIDTVSSLTPTYCSNGVYAGAAVSCGFSESVFSATHSQWSNNGNVFPSSLSGVYSPATGQNYDLNLVSSTPSWALYQNNAGGYVSIGQNALAAY